MILEKRRRHVARYREIGAVLAKYGWTQLIARLGLAEFFRTKAGRGLPESPVRLREALEELGPTFVKLGQLLSTRADIIPESYLKELVKLQDTAPVVPSAQIIAVIEQEFGSPVNSVYHSFDVEPIAAASLGQVHGAVLHTGEEVIVKVQRPDILGVIDTDIEIMQGLAAFLEQRWEAARWYGLVDLIDEYSAIIHQELDYRQEGRNTDRLRDQLAKVPNVNAPLVFWDLTTPRVLTIERIRGDRITDVAALQAKDVNTKEVAQRFVSSFLQQIFIDGFYHADPHPGNVLITSDGAVALLDCGQASRLDHTTRSGLIRLLIAFDQQNAREFTDELLTIGIPSGPVNVREFGNDIGKLLRRYYDVQASEVNIGDLLSRVLRVSAQYRVRFPAQFAVLAKVFTQLHDSAAQLDSDFSFTDAARPYIGKAVRTELNIENFLPELFQAVSDAKHFAFTLPDRASELLRRLVEGTLKLEGRVQGLEDLTTKVDKVGNRISFALICSGIVVASSIIVASGRGHAGVFGLPTLGVIGYILAAFFGMWLLISIIRGGRL